MVVTDHNSMRNRQTLEAYKRRAISEARSSLMGFTLYTNPLYETGWFNELLSAELDQFLADVEAGITYWLIAALQEPFTEGLR